MTPLPQRIAAIFEAVPGAARARLIAVRGLIFQAAKVAEVGPLEETLKWGEPAYLPQKPRVGTTIRLGGSAKRPDEVSLYVPCQTTLVDLYRDRFPDDFRYDGNRAVHLPAQGAFSEAALEQVIILALTYHRAKRSNP